MRLPANITQDAMLSALESAAQDSAFGLGQKRPTQAQAEAENYRVGRFRWPIGAMTLCIQNPRYSVREGGSGRNAWRCTMASHYGYIEGTSGADGDPVDCFIGMDVLSPRVFVINQAAPNGQFDEHKVMLCFGNEAQARSAYLRSYERNWQGLQSMVACTLDQLKWWLKHGDMSAPMDITKLPVERLPVKTTHWTNEALPLTGTLDDVYAMLLASDGTDGLMLDSATMQEVLSDPDVKGVFSMDALTSPFKMLERKMTIMQKVMDRTGGEVTTTAMQVSEPFKQRGTVNVAVIYELSDGQTVTIIFHNPDADPAKLKPDDELVSWKWMLNKKDVTIVVAPERGKDLMVQEVARRIMRLAQRNSAAFAKANTKRAERQAAIGSLKTEIEGLEKELKTAENELELVKQQVEEKEAQAPSATSGATFSVGDYLEAHFPSLNKLDSVKAYRERFSGSKTLCKVEKVLTLSAREWDKFANNLMGKRTDLGEGGMATDSPLFTEDDFKRSLSDLSIEKQREWDRTGYRKVTVVQAKGRETLVVDPQGYDYARYVGFDPKPASAPVFARMTEADSQAVASFDNYTKGEYQKIAPLQQQLQEKGLDYPSIAQFMQDINSGNRSGYSVKALQDKAKEMQATIDGLNNGTVTPRKVLGVGGKKPDAIAWAQSNLNEVNTALASGGFMYPTNIRNYVSTLNTILRKGADENFKSDEQLAQQAKEEAERRVQNAQEYAKLEQDFAAARKYEEGTTDGMRQPLELSFTIPVEQQRFTVALKNEASNQERYKLLTEGTYNGTGVKALEQKFSDKVELNAVLKKGVKFGYFSLAPRAGYTLAKLVIDTKAEVQLSEDDKYLPQGWTQSREGGLATKTGDNGAIVDKNAVAGKWFITFHNPHLASTEAIFDTRKQALEYATEQMATVKTKTPIDYLVSNHGWKSTGENYASKAFDGVEWAGEVSDGTRTWSAFYQVTSDGVRHKLTLQAGFKDLLAIEWTHLDDRSAANVASEFDLKAQGMANEKRDIIKEAKLESERKRINAGTGVGEPSGLKNADGQNLTSDAAHKAVLIGDLLVKKYGFTKRSGDGAWNYKYLSPFTKSDVLVGVDPFYPTSLEISHEFTSEITYSGSATAQAIAKDIAEGDYMQYVGAVDDYGNTKDTIDDEGSVFEGKTVKYAFAAQTIVEKGAKEVGVSVNYGDFNDSTSRGLSFDAAVQDTVYGITAQLHSAGQIWARASIDEEGNVTLLKGSAGSEELGKPESAAQAAAMISAVITEWGEKDNERIAREGRERVKAREATKTPIDYLVSDYGWKQSKDSKRALKDFEGVMVMGSNNETWSAVYSVSDDGKKHRLTLEEARREGIVDLSVIEWREKDKRDPQQVASELNKNAESRAASRREENKLEKIKEDTAYLKDIAYSLGNIEGMTANAEIDLMDVLNKSGREKLLMKVYDIPHQALRDISNGLDTRKPHKLREEDMQEAFERFPDLKKAIDEAIERNKPKPNVRDTSQAIGDMEAPQALEALVALRDSQGKQAVIDAVQQMLDAYNLETLVGLLKLTGDDSYQIGGSMLLVPELEKVVDAVMNYQRAGSENKMEKITEPTKRDSDMQVVQSLIDGTADRLNVDYDQLIAFAEKYASDSDFMAALEKAMEATTAAQLAAEVN